MRAFGCLLGGGSRPRPDILDTELQEASVPHWRYSSIDVSLSMDMAISAAEGPVLDVADLANTAALDAGPARSELVMILQ
ncbi:hypothetical protein [Variovorax sp. V213]|uniref:hypothetical protein n=1 Tax=Variovorax sp. V213 TaxID=3065955 RepID=UPI0034E8EE07